MKKSVCFICFVCLSLAGIAAECPADVILLKNGRTINGVIIEDDGGTVRLEVNSGRITFAKSEIEKIERAAAEENARLREEWQKENRKWEQLRQIAIDKEKELEQRREKTETAEQTPVDFTAGIMDTPEIPESARKPAGIVVERKNLPGSYYLLCAPGGGAVKEKRPLLIVLHGYSDTAENMMNYWRTEGRRSGLIVACPKSIQKEWLKNDFANIQKMISEIKSSYAVDDKKIYLVGFSNGAHFALYLGLNHPKMFGAVVCVAGSLARARNLIGAVDLRSSRDRKTPVLVMIGLKDDRERIELAKSTKRELERYNYPVTYREFPNVPHVYMSWYSKEISAWLNKR